MRKQDLIQRARASSGMPLTVIAVALTTMLAACGGNSSTTCHNLPIATGLIGQPSYTTGMPNADGAVSASGLSSPAGSSASDGTHFYIVDSGNNRVLGYNQLPATLDAPADFVIGQANLQSNVAATSPTGLSGPSKVSISSDLTTLVVTDTKNNRVLLYSPLPTATGATPAIVVGQGDLTTKSTSYNCSGAAACSTSLNNPTGAMIANGELVVVDQSNNRALIWATVPTAAGTAADYVMGQPDFATTTLGSYDTVNSKVVFDNPTDVWTNGFDLYISDTNNNRVLYWSQIPQANYTTAIYVVGQTLFTRTSAGVSSQIMNGPTGVFSDGSRLFVADTGNNRVLVYSSPPSQIGPIASGVFGQQDFSHSAYNDDDQNGTPGDQQNNQSNVNPTNNTLYGPSGVFSFAGNLFVTDRNNHRVIEFPIASSVDGSDTGLCQ